MLKTNLKLVAISAMFGLSLTAGAGRSMADENGIVLKEVSSSDSSYCHIKYMAFTEQSLKSGDLEFNPNEIIDRYGSCEFDPKNADEVHKQMAFLYRNDAGENSGDSD